LDWLRKTAKEAGYLSAEEAEAKFKELQDKLETLTSSTTQFSEQRLKNQEAEARDSVRGWMSEAKIEDASGAKLKRVERLIAAWVNEDQERIDRWNMGGVEARNLVREGFDSEIKELGWTTAAPQSTTYAADKARSVAQGKTKLPAQGTATQKGTVTAPKGGPRKDPWADTHEQAYAMFQDARAARK